MTRVHWYNTIEPLSFVSISIVSRKRGVFNNPKGVAAAAAVVVVAVVVRNKLAVVGPPPVAVRRAH